MKHSSEPRSRMFQPSFSISGRTGAPDGVRPTVYVYSGIDSSSGGGISQMRGVANRRGGRGCVHVWGNMEDCSADIQVRIRVRTPSLGQTAKKQTDGLRVLGGWDPPDMHGPLPGRGAPGKGRQTQWQLNSPHPVTGSWARLPPTLTPPGG